MLYFALMLIALIFLSINLKSFWTANPELFKDENEKNGFLFFSFLVSLTSFGFLYADQVKTLPFWIGVGIWFVVAYFVVETCEKIKSVELFKESKEMIKQKIIMKCLYLTVFIHLFL